MKKPFLRFNTWARLLYLSEPDNIPTPTAALSRPQAMNCVPALIAALLICGVLGGISLLVPPFIDWDSGFGFLAWRGTLLGAANSIIMPDRANIAHAWWQLRLQLVLWLALRSSAGSLTV